MAASRGAVLPAVMASVRSIQERNRARTRPTRASVETPLAGAGPGSGLESALLHRQLPGRGASHQRLRAGSVLKSVIVGVTHMGQARPPAPAVQHVFRTWHPLGLLCCCHYDQETGGTSQVGPDATLMVPVVRAFPSAGFSRLAPAGDKELLDSPVWFSLPLYVPPSGSVPGGRHAACVG